MPSDAIKKRVNELLTLVGLESAADKRPVRNYSGGMKKRLDLATALVHKPKILFSMSQQLDWILNRAQLFGLILK